MAGDPQPLDQQFSIVDPQGRPNAYFIRWAQERQNDIKNSGVWGKITGSLNDQEDLKTALNGKLSVVETTTYGPNTQQMVSDPATENAAFSAGDVTKVSMASMNSGSLSNPGYASFNIDLTAFVGGASIGPVGFGTSSNRCVLVTYGTVTGWEFNAQPYVNANKIYHEGNLVFGTGLTYNAGTGILTAAGGGSTPWYINTPLAATFTKASGDATQLVLTDSADVGLIVNCGAPVAGQIARIAYKTLSNKALDWEVTVRLLCAAPNTANTGLSVYLMDSVGGRLVSYDLLRETNISGVYYWGSLASFTSNPFSYTPMRPVEWVRITATGAFLSFQISESGKQWVEVFNVGITAHLANRPDRIGFGSNTNRATGFRNMLTANYFTLTGPAV